MFSSPCSLRSTTCATLIALAATAGISRFESAPEKPAASLPAIVRLLATAARSPQAHTYPISIAACARAALLTPLTLSATTGETPTPLAAESPAADWPLTPPAIPAEISFFDWANAAPTAREHAYPYAVGPPRRGIAKKLRAAGHAWPGDSSARRSQVSRIARGSLSSFGAHDIRTADRGLVVARSSFSPSAALRARRERGASGEPGYSASPRSARRASAGPRPAFFLHEN